ncbi:MAG: hypothetical protein WAX69_18400 [Victivallales bacterium]
MKRYLELLMEGFAQIQRGRPKWSFVRELIANSLDGEITICQISISRDGRNPALIIVEDDGPGFENLKDAYTFYGPTRKKIDPSLRRRFNLGAKEFASIAKTMVIESTKGGVRFDNGERSMIDTRRPVGTKITVEVNWTQDDIEEIIEKLNLLIPPVNKRLEVNGEAIHRPEKIDSVEERLKTVLLGKFAISYSIRKTCIDVFRLKPGQKEGYLSELGIPIQPIECPYNVDIQQKVPMSPNSDHVSDVFLTKIYGIVLNTIRDELNQDTANEPWINQGIEDNVVTKATVDRIKQKRYGDKTVLWSSDTEANEKARAAGYEIVQSKTMSETEKNKFIEAGMQTSSSIFGSVEKRVEVWNDIKWNSDMQCFAEHAAYISNLVYDEPIKVEYICAADVYDVAQLYEGKLYFNLAHMDETRLKPPYSEYFTGLILHVLAHRVGKEDYGKAYIEELGRIAGKLAIKTAENPQTFEQMRNGNAPFAGI